MTNTPGAWMLPRVKEPAQSGEMVDAAPVAARELSGAERVLVGDLVRQRAPRGRVDRPGGCSRH